MNKRPTKPDFYKSFMEEGFFPDSNKIVKYIESQSYWMFKTGQKIYKIKKPFENELSSHLDKLFCKDAVKIMNLHSPTLECVEKMVTKNQDQYFLENSTSMGLFFGIEMHQLQSQFFVDRLIEKKKINSTHIDKIVHFLAEFHQKAIPAPTEEGGSPEFLINRINDFFYQSKKFIDITITQPLIDLSFFPLERFVQKQKKLLLKRLKKKLVREIHGNFIPSKIHVQGELVQVLSKTEHPLRNKFGDVAIDLAQLVISLKKEGLHQLAVEFVEGYVAETNDKDIQEILPFYQSIACFNSGLRNSKKMAAEQGKEAEKYKETAIKCYEQSIEEIRQLPN